MFKVITTNSNIALILQEKSILLSDLQPGTYNINGIDIKVSKQELDSFKREVFDIVDYL